MKVFFQWSGVREEPVGLVASAAQPLPIQRIAEAFGVLPATLTIDGVDTSLTLGEIMRLRPERGKKTEPFQVWGYLGPQEPGFRAYFLAGNGKRFSLQVVQQLHMSPATAVYSVVMVGEEKWRMQEYKAHANTWLNTGQQPEDSEPCRSASEQGLRVELAFEPLVLKQLFKGAATWEVDVYQDLQKLRESTTCPSLPQMVSQGFFLASGKKFPQFGDVDARLIKPLGSCVSGKLFTGQQVCKAALDLFLALFHLYLLDRRHRNVKAENIIHVEDQNQFMLIDFKEAYTAYDDDHGEVADSVSLVLTLAQMAGWDGEGGNHGAAIQIGRVSGPVLVSFAYYAFALPSGKDVPDFHHWMPQLAVAAGVPPPDLTEGSD